MKQNIQEAIHVGQFSYEDLNLVNFISDLNNHLGKIPTASQKDACIEMEIREEYGNMYINMVIRWARPETDEEEQSRIKKKENSKTREFQRRKKLYEELKSEFE